MGFELQSGCSHASQKIGSLLCKNYGSELDLMTDYFKCFYLIRPFIQRSKKEIKSVQILLKMFKKSRVEPYFLNQIDP